MERLIAIIGPTAVGKTNISINLAAKLNTEIISGDSMLVFRSMNIGTAKPTLAERQGIVHHLIDILEPTAEFSVAEFQTLAAKHTSIINNKGNIPILAGGTGLYVKALLEGYQFNTTIEDAELRQELNDLAEKNGNQHVHDMLAKIQPETAARLHPNNLRRVIRALEVYYKNGETVSQVKQVLGTETIYNCLVIGLTMDRSLLYERINLRVDQMLAQGLVDEVAQLLNSGVPRNSQSMQGIGYKEIAEYLSGRCELAVAVDNIKQATRNFAKRQLTWYRKMPYIFWLDVSKYNSAEELLSYIHNIVAGKFYK